MINKIVATVQDAVAGIQDGSTVLVGGFGGAGQPLALVDALIEQGARELTIVNNNAGNGEVGLAALLKAGQVRKIICSFPRQADSYVFDGLYRSGKLELELVPQGTLAERVRAGGAGIGGFYTRTGLGTMLAEGREVRNIDGVDYLFELPIKADVALIKAKQGDRWGNLTFRSSGRNFNPVMATAAKLTVVQTQHVVELGALDPERVVTPGIFVNRVLHVPYGDPPVP
jgi:3-oxoadipate CoA-transferase alpha subunit